MVNEAERVLAKVVGLPLWEVGRAATILWLQFGDRVAAPTAGSPERMTGRFALHVSCPWRIRGPDGLITGFSDMWEPADPGAAEHFDAGRPGDAVADRELRNWMERHGPLAVETVVPDACGGFALELSKGFALEVFADGVAAEQEHWRMLQPGHTELGHFVVRGTGGKFE